MRLSVLVLATELVMMVVKLMVTVMVLLWLGGGGEPVHCVAGFVGEEAEEACVTWFGLVRRFSVDSNQTSRKRERQPPLTPFSSTILGVPHADALAVGMLYPNTLLCPVWKLRDKRWR